MNRLAPSSSLAPASLGAVDRFAGDRRGAIMVIAIFMSAFLVGAMWYMLGLGEAILYRENLRSAADATAFSAATVHALGMNMIVMLNIVMAAIMAIMILIALVFFLAVVVTIAATILSAGTATASLVQFDVRIMQFSNKLRDKFAFPAIKALNYTEGTLAITMPFAAKAASWDVADEYNGAVRTVTETDAFSPSMIPLRLPYVSERIFNGSDGNGGLNAKFRSLPILRDFPDGHKGTNPVEIGPPDLQRYGLPVQDDNFNMLCMHGGMVLVDGFATLITAFVPPGVVRDAMSTGFRWFGGFFGELVVGQNPSMFCKGLSPYELLRSILGKVPIIGWISDLLYDAAASAFPDLKKIEEKFRVDTDPPLVPVKPFDMARNGNGWMQVWSTVKGNPEVTKGANTGVMVPSWGLPQTRSEAVPGDDEDFAQAEFYYDCGAPDSGSNQTIFSHGDTSGNWDSCKYNAMWNFRWKARLRRYHQFEYDIVKSLGLFLYNSLGAESYITKLANMIPRAQIGSGSFFKVQILDRVKACAASGADGNSLCPLPLGTGFGKIKIGGRDYDYEKEVFH